MRSLLFISFTLLTFTLLGQRSTKAVKKIPLLFIYDINGKTDNLKNISNGKITFIDFWFIPCGPCFAEMNMLHKLYDKYKDNSNVSFLTITITDSSFVRPLMENKNTSINDTYDYFKTLAELDTFKLPVYFIQDVCSKMKSFKKDKGRFIGKGWPRSKDNSNYPNNVFGFSGYPTILIFDKKGNLIYNKTGFTKDVQKQQQKKIEGLINTKI